MDNLYEQVVSLINKGISFVLITIISSDGSSPRKEGSKMIVCEDGKTFGTIGGGPLEYECIKIAQNQVLKNNKCLKKFFELSDLTLKCGGNVEIFFEPCIKKDRVILFGAGHIALSLVKLFKMLNFNVVIIDDRTEYLNQLEFQNCQKILISSYELDYLQKECNDINFNENDYVIIVTHGHEASDGKVLEYILKFPFEFKYVGMIGSKNKVYECINELIQKNISVEKLKKVFAPIGLNIGGETPNEIAISIVSEILSVKYLKDGKHLKDKKGYFNN